MMVLLAIFLSAAALRAEDATSDPNWLFEATNHLGQWIWDTNTFDKQTCLLWREFEIPRGTGVSNAILRITVDNGYTIFLDGRELGRGSDWRTVTEYDVSRLLPGGRHVLGVEAFNDRLAAGLILGFQIKLAGGRTLEILSDTNWLIVPESAQKNWLARTAPLAGWHPAVVIGGMNHHPWESWPYGLTIEPPFLPILVHFWQTGWFQAASVTTCGLAVLFSFWLLAQLAAQMKTQRFLQEERERIARDIHDGLGAQLTQLVLLGEVAQSEQPAASASRRQFNQICLLARELSQDMDEVVWAINSRRDTLRDFVNYICKYAQVFLNPTTIRCRLDVEPEIPPDFFELSTRRNLFLAVKEALNNAAKYSQADELFLRIYRQNPKFVVVVEDNGCGFDPAQAGPEHNGLHNMVQRMDEIGGVCTIDSQPNAGCRVCFTVPLNQPHSRGWFWRPAWKKAD